ncbi:hotdog domain-containing protein [Streptomyces coeruleorubidus]|uniref:hotdog domain-containing protein n=1 Tax=Streptomyces coeruleorubidus TaxID=116188 RepID=UPI003702A5BC
MTLADTAARSATFLNLPPGANTSTVESKANFFRAVRSGTVHAEARPGHVGRLPHRRADGPAPRGRRPGGSDDADPGDADRRLRPTHAPARGTSASCAPCARASGEWPAVRRGR